MNKGLNQSKREREIGRATETKEGELMVDTSVDNIEIMPSIIQRFYDDMTFAVLLKSIVNTFFSNVY